MRNRCPTSHLRRCLAPVLIGWIAWSAPVIAWTGSDYSLDLQPNFADQALSGQARIELIRTEKSQDFAMILSPRLELQRAEVDGVKRVPEKTKDGWRIKLLPEQATATALILEIDFAAKASSGLVFGDDYVYTAFHTCRWMPCAGSDLSRATVTFTLRVPESMLTVASGERQDGSEGRQIWRQSRLFPLYTLGFAAGSFSEVVEPLGDRELRFLGSGQTPGQLRAKFRDSALMLTFLEGKAGIEMPHRTYTQVLVPGGAAQEVSSFSMIGARWLDPILENPQEDWIVIHEMAHQWWGNWITCETWNELWLSEGLAVFMTMAWKQHRWGEKAYQREIRLLTEAWKRAQDAGFDKPLRWPGQYPNLRVRRAIQYSKAALFLVELREQLGENAFWNGIRSYTQRHAGKIVVSEDFQAVMEKSAGRSLQGLFDTWVY